MGYQHGDGYTCIDTMDGGGEYRAPLEDGERLLKDWDEGKAFLRFMTVHGAYIVLKASRVCAIMIISAESLARWKELRREEDRESSMGG